MCIRDRETLFDDSLTNGDSVTYAMKGGKATIALTNGALAAIAGKVLNNDAFVGINAGIVAAPGTVDIDASGTPYADETYVAGSTVYIVNGALDDVTAVSYT